jgi:cytochrome c biogenesis protein CcmG/thiol:disulfide interchange protein DsbE
MGGKGAIALGLLAGIIAGGAMVGGALALLPAPAPVSLPTPSPTITPTAPPTPSTTPVPVPSSAAPSASAAPSSSATASASPAADVNFGIGRPAPPLSVPRVGGGTVDLAALRGKPVWVNFMATWCPSCRDELPVMNGLASRYAKDGLVVVLVDVREDAATVKGYLDSLKVALPAGLDASGAAQGAWKALALPVHFFVDKAGIVRDAAVGSVGPDLMAKGLQAILPGVTVTP